MIVKENQVFNLWNTNGRRKDILNALHIYLTILDELNSTRSNEIWAAYPKSLTQYLFYQKALEASPEVFSKHPIFDKFQEEIRDYETQFLNKTEEWLNSAKYKQLSTKLNKAIEQRARHYTSNLVKIGFANDNRVISPAGQSFLTHSVTRDSLEELLPIDNTNLVIFRQLLKLRIFSESKNGIRKFYSPILMALYMLLNSERNDHNSFTYIIQGLNPYANADINNKNIDTFKIESILDKALEYTESVPAPFQKDQAVEYAIFKEHIKNRKSTKITEIYYEFYKNIFDLTHNPTATAYEKLLDHLEDNKEALQKAFGEGKHIFDTGRGVRYDFKRFLQKNSHNPLLKSQSTNSAFFTAYSKSKHIDSLREYSDTTIRLLGATGLFKFNALPELKYSDILQEIFSEKFLRENIFGEMSDDEYVNYEIKQNGTFQSDIPLTQILKLTDKKTKQIVKTICSKYGATNTTQLQNQLASKLQTDFEEYINTTYPKERVIELLKKFDNRKNDLELQKQISEIATVPTIYEYIVAIAWYYLSNKTINVYQSLNLTLNADFEPIIHAGAGMGDIIIDKNHEITMLEVTLMNTQNQKRGEWEPVLRHSLNLKAENPNKRTITFFIAPTLDTNTINIWRAVAAVPLESTRKRVTVDGVVIMPLTNHNIIKFLENNIDSDSIINATRASFGLIPKLTNTRWHEQILEVLHENAP